MNLFKRPAKIMDLPDAFGRRLSGSEVSASLIGKSDDPLICALGQIIYYRSQKLTDAGKKDAWKGQDTRYQLGGANALDELLDDVIKLLDQGTIPEDLKEYFRET